jgi:hypothetical protein
LAETEFRRARAIVVAGVLVWAAIAALVMARYGAIASIVLVGWGGSSVVCLGFMFGPLAAARVAGLEDDATFEPPVAIIDLRDAVVSPHGVDELELVAESAAR